ncbi:hypothetical protein DE146DRAFT_309608 [Phaeosphaeria sp. MPI-PUGE-AT-0046c]|nr:hypothetical protein DE146DRAFT_309608 [Phaeosphaeria sp. MPI-PUGE-AT-0046c]
MACLESLSDDILHLVVSYLNTERVSALRYLRSISRRLSLYADSELYRTIVLEEDNFAQEQASYRCIERLLDPTDALRHQVRFLRVRAFNGDEGSFCMNTRMLQDCIKFIHKLDSFSWDIEAPLPSSLLDVLHLHHPLAQLCVFVRQLDQKIVASSQLHRLSISVPCSDVISPKSTATFEQLRDVLMQNHNIRALSIDAHLDCKLRDAAMEELRDHQQTTLMPCGQIPLSTLPRELLDEHLKAETSITVTNKVQIPLQPTDKLPKLEELAIKGRTYTLDEDHCRCLQRCIGWSRLKRLTLNCSDYGSFFETFTGEVPQLKHLDIFIQVHDHRYRRRPKKLIGACNFISSLSNLKALVVRYDDIELCHEFWRDLVATHGERLESFSLIRSCSPCLDSICQDGLWNFLSSFTAVKDLELVMPNSTFSSHIRCAYCSVYCSMGTMPYMPSLERLSVSTRVSSNDERSLHACYTNHAHDILQQLWSSYVVQPSSCQLDAVNLKFWRWTSPSPHARTAAIAGDMVPSEINFESTRRDHQLVIKARDERKVTTTYYNEIREMFVEHCIKVSYVATHQEQRDRRRG